MKFAGRSIVSALALSVLLMACGQGGEKGEAPPTAPVAEAPPPPVPADFEPCNTITFDDVEAVIGTRPTISADDRTGTASPGWATCTYARRDASAGATLTVRIAKFESSADAATRHRAIVGGVTGAEAVANDADDAYVWVEGDTLFLQYQKGWWLTRRAVQGATDAQARARLLAAPRWP